MLPEEEKWALMKQNILNAEIAYNYSKRTCCKTEVVYVIQGWDEESLRYCSETMAKLDAQYYAVGSLIGLQPEEIVRRVRLVRSLISNKAKLHLFAVANPLVIKEVKSLIDSVDSSSASIAGAMKEIMRPSGGRVNINHTEHIMNCGCPVCSKYKAAIFLSGGKGSQNYYNKLRKIHNAYQLAARLKKEIENS
jgi:tRNA-guanine family transglycosylase